MQLRGHAKLKASEMNMRQQAAEPASKPRANEGSSPDGGGDGGHHLDHPVHRVILSCGCSAEGGTPSQSWIPLSRLMTPHMYQEGMKMFITYAYHEAFWYSRASNQAGPLASVKEQMALTFIVVDSGVREMVSTRGSMFELFHWRQEKEHLEFLTSLP